MNEVSLATLREICNTEQRVCGDRGTEWFTVTAFVHRAGGVLVQLDDGTDDRPIARSELHEAAVFLEWLLSRRVPGNAVEAALPSANMILGPRVARAVAQVRAER